MATTPGHVRVEYAQYEIVLHPAITRKVTVEPKGGQGFLSYQQDGIHELRGEGHPHTYVLGLEGGPHGENFAITVHDPSHRILSVTVEVLRHAHDPASSWVVDTGDVETIRFENGARTCPPFCA